MASKKPIIIRGILNPQTLAVAQQYFKHRFTNMISAGAFKLGDQQEPLRYSVYGDPISQVLLKELTSSYSAATGKELVMTHSFTSLYVPGAELRKHTDRPECEYTATLTIYNEPLDMVWPVHVLDPDTGVTHSVRLNPGDSTIYRGHDCPHWRDPQQLGYNISIFFHFIDKNGSQVDNPKAYEANDHIHRNFGEDVTLAEKLESVE